MKKHTKPEKPQTQEQVAEKDKHLRGLTNPGSHVGVGAHSGTTPGPTFLHGETLVDHPPHHRDANKQPDTCAASGDPAESPTG